MGASGAFAAEASRQVQAEPSAKALALTRRYVAAMHMDQAFKPLMSNLAAVAMQQQLQANKDISETQRNQLASAMSEAVEESMDAGMMSKLMEKMVPAYATVFSEDELQALVDFYESPRGQAIIAKMPSLTKITSQAALAAVPEIQEDLQARFKTKIESLKLFNK